MRYVVDVSHHNGKIDWHKASNTPGLVAVMVKATQGDHFKDPMLEENVESAIQNSLSAGVYMFPEPWIDPRKQVRYFAGTVITLNPTKLAVDLEWVDAPNGKEGWSQLTKDEREQFILDLFDELKKMFSNARIKIYLGKSFYMEMFQGFDFSQLGDLWVADDKSQDQPILPPFFKTWHMWQRKPRKWVNGFPNELDLDVLNDGEPAAEAL